MNRSTIIAVNTLSMLRMGVGLGLLGMPSKTAELFLLPAIPNATIALRMAGVRDFAIGGLLYATKLATLQARNVEPKQDNSPASSLLGKGDLKLAEKITSNDELRRALVTGIVVDAIDIVSCIICFEQGTLPGDAALLIGGGAVAFFGLGVLALSRSGLKN